MSDSVCIAVRGRTYFVDNKPDTEFEMAKDIFHLRSFLVEDHNLIPRIKLTYSDGTEEICVGYPYSIITTRS